MMTARTRLKWLFIVLTLTIGRASVIAEVKLPALISDHMVLQQGMPISIWGAADPGENVTVRLGDRQASVVAGTNGKWQVSLPPSPAGGPFEMTIRGKNIITLADVIVGEVWVCSGQSNMEWQVRNALNPEQEIAASENPNIRCFTVKHVVSAVPLEDLSGKWELSTPETAKGFTAVGYFFARDLQRALSIPIGLIHSSWGGTPAEAWISDDAIRAYRYLEPILWNWQRTLAEYPGAKQKYDRAIKDWEEQALKAKEEGKQPPPRPVAPQGPGHSWTPSGLYNAMIAPMTSYAIRGAIWYQGESNARPLRSLEYRRLFQGMIEDWRRAWDQPLPFLFVQLANFMERRSEPEESAWAELREAQMRALGLPATGMAVAIDIGEADNIHPKNKQEVGRRLALAARAEAYGENIVYSGPLFQSMKLEPGQIRVFFRHTGPGLEARGSSLEGFAVAGEDRKFAWADARIEGTSVVVSSPQVPNPLAVRYAWADNPSCNLYNKEGLPASPFRTDDWPGTLTAVGPR